MTANAVMTKVAAAMLTPKCRAYCGRTGATTPYPSATTKFAATRTQTSRGNRGLDRVVQSLSPAELTR